MDELAQQKQKRKEYRRAVNDLVTHARADFKGATLLGTAVDVADDKELVALLYAVLNQIRARAGQQRQSQAAPSILTPPRTIETVR